jgi:cytochrome P450
MGDRMKSDENVPVVESLIDTRGRDAWPYYEAMHKHGPIGWDAGAKSWVVPSHDLCRKVLLDEGRFPRPNATVADDTYLQVAGRRHMTVLSSEDHDRMHKWWVSLLAPRKIDELREQVVRPIVAQTLDRMQQRGPRVDLAQDFAGRITIRVIAAMLGLPWEDEKWVSECRTVMDDTQAFIDNMRFGLTEEIVQRALAATQSMNELLDPFIDTRRSGDGEDLISRLWRDGPGLLPDWSNEDVRTFSRSVFFGGTDTTKDSICGAMFLILSQPGLASTLVAGGRPAIERFTEEALRLQGPVQFRARTVAADTELGGVQLKRNDMITTLNAAANRDPGHYGCPHAVDLARPVARDHFAFSVGRASCVGAPLARAELQESLLAILARFPNIRLDAQAPAPSESGFAFRSIAPLNVLLE